MGGDQALRQLKAEHLKEQGDAALKVGNFRIAWQAYSDALELGISRDVQIKVLSNRSLAYTRAGRYSEALGDAERCCSLAPDWSKGHYRRGSSLEGLRRHVDAVFAFQMAFKLSNDPACDRTMRSCIGKLSLEQLGSFADRIISEMEQKGELKRPQEVMDYSESVMQEAWYLFMKAENCPKGRKSRPPWKYHDFALQWLQDGLPPSWAYQIRAGVHIIAKYYLQARKDAELGISDLLNLMDENGAYDNKTLRHELAAAHQILGKAFLAEPEDNNKDMFQAAKAFYLARDLHPSNTEYCEQLKSLEDTMSLEDLEQAAEAATASMQEMFAAQADSNSEVTIVSVVITVPQTKLALFNAGSRAAICGALASMAGVESKQVTLQRVCNVPGIRGFEIKAEVNIPGPPSSDCCRRIMAMCAPAAPGDNGTPARFPQELVLHDEKLKIFLVEGTAVTATAKHAIHTKGKRRSTDDTVVDNDAPLDTETRKQEQQRPADTAQHQSRMELELPYKSYRLVYGDGTPVPRKDKHAFSLTIVRYDGKHREQDIWTEINDGSCRWRQSSSEISAIALKVPKHLKPSQLDVVITPYYLKVSAKESGEVYLEGQLERGIIPDSSTWLAGQGEGEDGFMFILEKMNLELLQKSWLHNLMWWPRLFTHHGKSAWDDSEKDYSDLPAPVMQRFSVAEALKEEKSKLEQADTKERHRLDDLDDARLRWREARLEIMRKGPSGEWTTAA